MVKVGQKLSQSRLKKGLTINEAARATKIRPEFLLAIEKGEYQKLPEKTYVQGFVRNYAEYLGFSRNEIIPLFRREFDEKTVFKVLPEGFTKSLDIPQRRIKIGATAILVFVFFILLLGYIFFQFRNVFFNPYLQVYSPKEMEILKSSHISVSGKADPNSTVFVNSDPVSIDKSGAFSKQIDIFEGKTNIKIKAVNRFGKETIIEREVELRN